MTRLASLLADMHNTQTRHTDKLGTKIIMASVQKLPAADVLLELAREQTNRQIGERYGVTAEAVRQKLAAAGFRRSPERPDHRYYLPWRIRADHAGDVVARRLRSYSKTQQGKPISDTERRLLGEFVRFMDGDNSLGIPLSVHYDRTDEDGFWLEPRQPGDRDYIHPPEESVG